MHPYETKYRIAASAFYGFSLILILTILFMFITRSVSTVIFTGLVTSFTGICISIPFYNYYRTRKEEVKQQSQYEAEALGVLGQENIDSQEAEEKTKNGS